MPTKTVNNVNFNYLDRGHGSAVVLIHGFPLDSRIWEAQVEALSDRYRVIAPDLRGFGKSTSSEPFSIESLVGTAIATYRDHVQLTTTGGTLFTATGRITGVDGSPVHLRRACDASLRRLGVDDIDLYLLAQVDPDVAVEDSIGVLASLAAAGKVRRIGLVDPTSDDLLRAAAIHPIAAVATGYSLLNRRAEREILPVARSVGASLIAHKPLSRGLLTGRLTSFDGLDETGVHRRDPQIGLAAATARVRRVAEFASFHDVSVSRLALAWLLAQGPDIVPVPGTMASTHAEMNAAAAGIEWTPGQLAAIDAAIGAESPDRSTIGSP